MMMDHDHDHDHDHDLNMTGHDHDHAPNMTGHEDIRVLQADFRATVIQAITDAGDDPEHPEIRPQIEMLEHEYANHLEQTGIYISGKNDIPGFRQVVFLGPGLSCIGSNRWTGSFGIIAITFDGRLVTGSVKHRNPDNRNSVTTVQAIDALVDPYHPEQEFVREFFHFYLDEKNDNLNMIVSFRDIKSYIAHCNLEFDTRTEIKCFLFQQFHDRLALVRCAILAALDRNVVHDLQKYNMINISDGSWLTGSDGATRDVITARQQAVRAYPLMFAIFQVNRELYKVIDAKTSLSKAMANYFHVDERRIKRLSGLTWKQIGSDPEYSWSTTSNMISEFLCLPDKCFPKTECQFQDLEILREFGCSVYEENLIEFAERLSKNGNPWRFIDRMKQTSGSNVLDAMNFLVQKLLAPAMIAEHKISKGYSNWSRRYYEISAGKSNWAMMFDCVREKMGFYEIRKYFNVGELLDWSERYHRNFARYEDRLDLVAVKQDGWSGMLRTIDLGNGCIARELTSPVALKAQGRAENHCVGGYVSRVLNSNNHSRDRAVMIFSLEQNGEILGTVEIICSISYSGKFPKPDDFGKPPKPDDSGKSRKSDDSGKSRKSDDSGKSRKSDDFGQEEKYLHVQVGQNHAHGNTKPSRMTRKLAEQVVTRLQQAGPKTFLTYLDGLHETIVNQDRISGLEPHIVKCRFDPHNRAHFEKVWNELVSALPKRFRENGLDAFIMFGLSRERA